ncbi:regulation of nuclear pre-mRNA domain-containing protein 2 [Phlebotomus argentipes]|uniref:regulation of nuclear pre-mRNA domain-containing protein 2 n=1 Tax=Phlebotomus argentipes TaxID=94469 RepID=UPI0028929AE3|nr:regulation of nuclear pre-mRNA domain-containing protein 2 [Phlebotomus argentipes]
MSVAPEEFDTVVFEKNLSGLKDTQDSISSMSTWCLQWRSHHKKIVSSWLTVLKQVKVEHRLTLFHLANDVIQYSKRNNYEFVESWGTTLQRATTMVRDEKVKSKILRIFKIWEQRGVYNEDFLADLVGLLNMPPPAKKNQESKEPEVADETTALIANVRDCVKLQERTDKSFKNLSKMPQCDVDNIKQNLKDRSHVEDVEKELEECLTNLESYMNTLKAEIKARGILITALVQADEFYHNQRGDVKTVAIAYRNFGNRVKAMKKKLEELTPSLPSPIPSPDINAPSPEPDVEFEFPGSGANYSNGFMSYMDGGALPFDINDFHRDSHSSQMRSDHRASGQQIQVIDSRGSSQSEAADFSVNNIFKNIINDTPPSKYIPSLQTPQPVPPVAPNSLPSYLGVRAPDQVPYNPGMSLDEFTTEEDYGRRYGDETGQSYTPSIVPPPVPPPIRQNSMNNYGGNWGNSGLEWLGNNSTGYDQTTETPSSPPHFDRKPTNDTGMIEYIENSENSGATDVDHRQLNLPSEILSTPSKVKNRAVDVDHRNLISLTGSPRSKANSEKEIPPPPVAPPLLWPPSSGQDVDMRRQSSLTPGNAERVSPPKAGEAEEPVVPPPLPPTLIPVDPPPGFDAFMKESMNANSSLLPNFQKPPPGFVVPSVPPLNNAMGKKIMKSPNAKNVQNGPDNVESVDMEMSDDDIEEYHRQEEDGNDLGGDQMADGEGEEMDNDMRARGIQMGFMQPPGMNFSPYKGPPPLLPTPPGGPMHGGGGGNGSWNGPPSGPGGNFMRGGFFGGDRMRPPFGMQPLFNFRPGMNMRGGVRAPRGRPHPFRGNPMFRGGGGGNRGARSGNW